ncbi:MAG: alpha/beta fold hydrolase [Armatimonadota bacterium]
MKNVYICIFAVFSMIILLPTVVFSQNILLAGSFERTIKIDNKERSYTIYIPESIDMEKPISLVIALHGGGGNAKNMAETTNFNKKADEEGFIVAYPNGSGNLPNHLLTWNAGNCCGYALENDIDDVRFIKDMIESLIKQLKVDPNRVYVTGFSNGGMMAYRLACEIPKYIAAIAVVSGSMNIECKSKEPVSVLIMHGTADKNVIYEGGKPKQQFDKHLRSDSSVAYAASYWVRRNDCDNTAKPIINGKVIKTVYDNGKNGTSVVVYKLIGVGHVWPGNTKKTSLTRDPAFLDIDATDIIWDFFKSHPKKN